MNKRVIAVDCDDVIVATAPAILRYYNQHYHTTIQLKDFYSKDLTLWAAEDAETAIRRVDEFLATKEYQTLTPFSDAITVITQLAQYHDLHIVTGRPDFLTTATKHMLQHYFPDIFKRVEFTNFFGKMPRSKSNVCQELGADLLIDDHLHHAKVVAECGIEVLLFGDYPWNQASSLPQRVQRVRDWHEVAKLLLPKH